MRLNAVVSFVLAACALIIAGIGAAEEIQGISLLAIVTAIISVTFAILAVGDVLSESRRT